MPTASGTAESLTCTVSLDPAERLFAFHRVTGTAAGRGTHLLGGDVIGEHDPFCLLPPLRLARLVLDLFLGEPLRVGGRFGLLFPPELDALGELLFRRRRRLDPLGLVALDLAHLVRRRLVRVRVRLGRGLERLVRRQKRGERGRLGALALGVRARLFVNVQRRARGEVEGLGGLRGQRFDRFRHGGCSCEMSEMLLATDF